MIVREATGADFHSFYGREPAGIWFGMCAVENGVIVGFGAILWRQDPRPHLGEPGMLAWAIVDVKAPVPAVRLHRKVVLVLKTLCRQLGEPAVYCNCDARIPGAERWLQRLGFVQDVGLSLDLQERVMRWPA